MLLRLLVLIASLLGSLSLEIRRKEPTPPITDEPAPPQTQQALQSATETDGWTIAPEQNTGEVFLEDPVAESVAEAALLHEQGGDHLSLSEVDALAEESIMQEEDTSSFMQEGEQAAEEWVS